LLIAIAVAVLILLIFGGTVILWMIYRATRKPTPPLTVASFRADYQEGSPAPGWKYLWNPSGEVGKTNNYRDLIWNGQAYAFDENPSLPRAAPARFLRIYRGAGHPGQGQKQRGDIDTYAIMGFTVTNTGFYLITNSYVSRTDGKVNGNINVRVFINEMLIGPELVSESKTRESFDRPIGVLKAGDCLYVAVGPNGMDRNDHFQIDFTLVAGKVGKRQLPR
jgi:hypothetical protein